MTKSDRRVKFLVSGMVQGVGFRYFTSEAARTLGVSGWVRNRRDGAVEGEAHGTVTAVESFLDEVRRGPEWGRIDRLAVEEIELISSPEPEFEIRS